MFYTTVLIIQLIKNMFNVDGFENEPLAFVEAPLTGTSFRYCILSSSFSILQTRKSDQIRVPRQLDTISTN